MRFITVEPSERHFIASHAMCGFVHEIACSMMHDIVHCLKITMASSVVQGTSYDVSFSVVCKLICSITHCVKHTMDKNNHKDEIVMESMVEKAVLNADSEEKAIPSNVEISETMAADGASLVGSHT